MRINQVQVRAYPSHQDVVRGGGSTPMKTYVEGTAVKCTMILSEATATSTITIHDPGTTIVVDDVAMTKEADYVYSYVYQTPSNSLAPGDWIVTFKAVSGDETVITQDRFTLWDSD